jgi:hypothetical protein
MPLTFSIVALHFTGAVAFHIVVRRCVDSVDFQFLKNGGNENGKKNRCETDRRLRFGRGSLFKRPIVGRRRHEGARLDHGQPVVERLLRARQRSQPIQSDVPARKRNSDRQHTNGRSDVRLQPMVLQTRRLFQRHVREVLSEIEPTGGPLFLPSRLMPQTITRGASSCCRRTHRPRPARYHPSTLRTAAPPRAAPSMRGTRRHAPTPRSRARCSRTRPAPAS